MEGLKRGERGIAEVLAIAFMFLLIVLACTTLYAVAVGPLASSSDRQMQQKTEHIYKTLELAHVENYSISLLHAIAENLVLGQPVVEGGYLRKKVDGVLAYLRPPGFGVSVNLACPGMGTGWSQVYPPGAGPLAPATKQFTFKGKVSMIRAKEVEKVVEVDATVIVFKL